VKDLAYKGKQLSMEYGGRLSNQRSFNFMIENERMFGLCDYIRMISIIAYSLIMIKMTLLSGGRHSPPHLTYIEVFIQPKVSGLLGNKIP
jgi:hypothetical protein